LIQAIVEKTDQATETVKPVDTNFVKFYQQMQIATLRYEEIKEYT
jgi:hypothetical protein